MNDTDLDTILAIADGQLSGQAKLDALARIAADPELSEELAAQISAMDGLKSLEPALMTPSERTALRSNLMEELNLQPVAPVIGVAKRPRPWWQPVLGVASAAALLIAIVAVPSMFSSSDDSSAELVGFAPEVTTSAASATEFEGSDGDSASTRSAEVDPSTSSVDVPLIAEDAVKGFFAASPSPNAASVTTTSDDQAATGTDDVADEVLPESTEQSADLLAAAGLIAVDTAQVEECLANLGDDLPEGNHTARAATLDDGVTIVHFGVDTDDGVVYSVSIALESCAITVIAP